MIETIPSSTTQLTMIQILQLLQKKVIHKKYKGKNGV